MSLSYELAKELKNAGFPQNDPEENLYSEDKRRPYAPTLSELIEACGDSFRTLGKSAIDPWYATGFRASTNDNLTAGGSTPEEAVARLWLALNKKPI